MPTPMAFPLEHHEFITLARAKWFMRRTQEDRALETTFRREFVGGICVNYVVTVWKVPS